MSNILAKLGVSGRVEAAAVAHRLGLTDGPGRAMATWDDVARVLRWRCPGTTRGGRVERAAGGGGWCGAGRSCGSGPLHRKDLAELGDAAPSGPVLVAYVPDEGAKAALLAAEPDVYFTTSHFDGSPALLCRLDALDTQALTELAAEAWASRAPRPAARRRTGPRRNAGPTVRHGDLGRRAPGLHRAAGDHRAPGGDGQPASGGCRTSCSSGSGRCGAADLAELGDAAPTGPVLGARVPDEGAKAALIADEPDVYFTTLALRRLPGRAVPAGRDRRRRR